MKVCRVMNFYPGPEFAKYFHALVAGLRHPWRSVQRHEHRGGIQRPIEPCLRFSGFQRCLFLCIPAQTRDYNTLKTGIPGFSQSQIEP
jgi:hypothetical protein